MQKYMSPSLFQPHRARQAIRDAHAKKIPPLIGYYAALTSVAVTRVLAPLGFDCVWIDWEHSSCNVETMTDMVHTVMLASGGRTIPWVRVPGHDHAAIGYALDAGASIVVPQVETVEQAKHVVSAAKFGSKRNGTRSAPPFRLIPGVTDGSADGVRDVWQNWNDSAAIMIQIETLEGINNLDAILTEVPDIDVVWLGALDARVSMNLKSDWNYILQGPQEPEWLAALAKYDAVLKKHDKPRGGFNLAPPDTWTEVDRGYSFFLHSIDFMKLISMKGDADAAKAAVASWAVNAEK
ncbi:Pyruvate/Phosphoenolpyruvate kinase-like domain-containing protein [Cladorrhinum samala]|uniref:Pyruvate/Phosphoenolpyruvate kinase-like domain-containing protein n=1 Tax=Cladorrhinum samala TaxID=585594 RepID=A0AAV9HMN8_9PEZI|nr:Pyruvate/Phosphoenolpyruvate kinase-like domain-containing protein [Cladorrhinum samala]